MGEENRKRTLYDEHGHSRLITWHVKDRNIEDVVHIQTPSDVITLSVDTRKADVQGPYVSSSWDREETFRNVQRIF